MQSASSTISQSVIMTDQRTTDTVLVDIWARLLRARDDSKADWRWFTVATSAADRTPRARTVVLRDVVPAENRLDFHTDRRSTKYAELVDDPRVALHFLDRRAAMQVRMLGRATFLSEPHAAKIWHGLPEAARAHYEQAAAPGLDLADLDAVPDRPLGASIGEQNFTVVQVFVTDIDWLHLRSSGHCRASFQLKGSGWIGRWIAP